MNTREELARMQREVDARRARILRAYDSARFGRKTQVIRHFHDDLARIGSMQIEIFELSRKLDGAGK